MHCALCPWGLLFLVIVTTMVVVSGGRGTMAFELKTDLTQMSSHGMLTKLTKGRRPTTIQHQQGKFDDVVAENRAGIGDRAFRGTNLSQQVGSSKTCMLFGKHGNHLQILPDGTVNGTTDRNSTYAVLLRTAVSYGEVKIEGLASCLYLCMNRRGTVYAAHHFTDECRFKEHVQLNSYNTYSSVKYSTSLRMSYLALTGTGQSRRVRVAATDHTGQVFRKPKVSSIFFLTRSVDKEVVRQILGGEGSDPEEMVRVRHSRHRKCERSPDYKEQEECGRKCKGKKRKKDKRRNKGRRKDGGRRNRRRKQKKGQLQRLMAESLLLEPTDMPDSMEVTASSGEVHSAEDYSTESHEGEPGSAQLE